MTLGFVIGETNKGLNALSNCSMFRCDNESTGSAESAESYLGRTLLDSDEKAIDKFFHPKHPTVKQFLEQFSAVMLLYPHPVNGRSYLDGFSNEPDGKDYMKVIDYIHSYGEIMIFLDKILADTKDEGLKKGCEKAISYFHNIVEDIPSIKCNRDASSNHVSSKLSIDDIIRGDHNDTLNAGKGSIESYEIHKNFLRAMEDRRSTFKAFAIGVPIACAVFASVVTAMIMPVPALFLIVGAITLLLAGTVNMVAAIMAHKKYQSETIKATHELIKNYLLPPPDDQGKEPSITDGHNKASAEGRNIDWGCW